MKKSRQKLGLARLSGALVFRKHRGWVHMFDGSAFQPQRILCGRPALASGFPWFENSANFDSP
jgi:hypothetical protein